MPSGWKLDPKRIKLSEDDKGNAQRGTRNGRGDRICGTHGKEGNVGQQLSVGRNLSPNILTMIVSLITFEEISSTGLHWIPHQQFMGMFFTSETERAFKQLYNATQYHKIVRAKANVSKFICLQNAGLGDSTIGFAQNGYAIHVRPRAKTPCFMMKNRNEDKFYSWPLPPVKPHDVTPGQETQMIKLKYNGTKQDLEYLGMAEVENNDAGTQGLGNTTNYGNYIDLSAEYWTDLPPSESSVYNRGEVEFCYVGDTIDVSPNIGDQPWFTNNNNNNPATTGTSTEYPTWTTTSLRPVENSTGFDAQKANGVGNVRLHEETAPWNQHFFGMAPIKNSLGVSIGLQMSCVIESEMVIEFRFEDYWQLGTEEDPDYHNADALRAHWQTQARQRPQIAWHSSATETSAFVST